MIDWFRHFFATNVLIRVRATTNKVAATGLPRTINVVLKVKNLNQAAVLAALYEKYPVEKYGIIINIYFEVVKPRKNK